MILKFLRDQTLGRLNAAGQNLLHVLTINSGSCPLLLLEKLVGELMSRGLSLNGLDSAGRSCLHYACDQSNVHMIGICFA